VPAACTLVSSTCSPLIREAKLAAPLPTVLPRSLLQCAVAIAIGCLFCVINPLWTGLLRTGVWVIVSVLVRAFLHCSALRGLTRDPQTLGARQEVVVPAAAPSRGGELDGPTAARGAWQLRVVLRH